MQRPWRDIVNRSVKLDLVKNGTAVYTLINSQTGHVIDSSLQQNFTADTFGIVNYNQDCE